MKIKAEHYSHLKKLIAPLNDKISQHREYLVNEGKAKDIETRLAWDLAHAAKLTSFICNVLYHYLNDIHITTALKKIVVELEQKGGLNAN
jgi:hypothetical protein